MGKNMQRFLTKIFLTMTILNTNGIIYSIQNNQSSVILVSTSVELIQNAGGQNRWVVCINWKNTGNRPIRQVWAKIRGFDEMNNELPIMPVSDYPIYTVSNSEPGVAPGKTYIQSQNDAFVILPNQYYPYTKPKNVTVEFTKVSEYGFE